jgi:hypothetical protein
LKTKVLFLAVAMAANGFAQGVMDDNIDETYIQEIQKVKA